MARSPYVHDKVFKYVFGEPEGLPLLKSLINAYFKAVRRPMVQTLELLPREISENIHEKLPILDVVAKDESGQTVNIEVQTTRKAAFFERTLYYWARLFGRQMAVGADYRFLTPVVSINLLDYEFDMSDTWLHNFELPFTRHLGILYVELPKVLRLKTLDSEDLKMAESWSKFIEGVTGNSQDEELDSSFEEARHRMEKFMALTPEIVNEIRREIAYLDELTMKNIAREEGLAEGKEEGKAEGKAEGLAEGREEGRKAEQRAIALRLKAAGMDSEFIAKTTGLAIGDVEKL